MTLRRIHWTATIIALLLGAAHLALTPVFHPQLGEPAMWWAGSGLAVVLAALLNLQLLLRGALRPILLLANLATAGFWASLAPVVPEPQVFAGLAAFAVLTFTGWRLAGPAR